VVVALGLVAVIGFPLAAAASASRPTPVSFSALPPIRHSPGGAVQRVPFFVPVAGYSASQLSSTSILERPGSFSRALAALAASALGPIQGERLLGLPPGLPRYELAYGATPDDPGADAVINAGLGDRRPTATQAAALTDLASLLQVGEANQGGEATGRELPLPPDTDGIAISVLGRATTAGSCAARMDDLLELLSDTLVSPPIIDQALNSADASCPNDPTPLWLTGEAELLRTGAATTFQRLERAFPGSPGGWSGEADVLLLEARHDAEANEPFTTETADHRAALLLDRARSLLTGPDPGLVSVEAAAWTAAGDPSRAVGLDRTALAERPDQANGLQLADDLELTHQFGQAGDLLGYLPAAAATVPRSSLFPEPAPGVLGPSLGAGSTVGLTVQAQPIVSPAEVVLSEVLVPPFRMDQDPSTGDLLSAPADAGDIDTARPRDLLVAGDPTPAVRSDSPLLVAVGELAEGDLGAAVAGLMDMCAAALGSSAPTSDGPWCAGVPQQNEAVGVDLQLSDLWYSSGTVVPTASELSDRIAFDLENFYRWAGQYGRAAAVTAAWTERAPDSFLAADQRGEVAYLRGHDGAAANWFSRALALAPGSAAAEAERLKIGEAEAAEGDMAGGLRTFADVAHTAGSAPDAAANLEYVAAFDAAGVRLQAHDAGAATVEYQTARTVADNSSTGDLLVEVPTALDTNEGLADVQAGHPGSGLPYLRDALRADPGNPVFLQNAAYGERREGDLRAAVADYELALAADPTNYPAANDLGVLLADQGRTGAAASALRQAVGAGPRYALARFNLGVALGEEGPVHLLEADGDRAAAVRLDPSLANAAPVPQFDDGTVLTTLDLARPPPPGWHFAEAETVSPGAVASLGLLVLLAGLGAELARDKAAEKVEERVLERAADDGPDRPRWWSRFRPRAIVAAAVTAAVLTWPLASSAGATWTADALLALAVVLLVAAYMRIHLIIGRSASSPLRHETWVPPLGVAVIAAAAHLGFAPLPVAEAREESHRRRRWMAPLIIGVTGVTLLLISRLTGAPSARAFGSAALVIASSALIPVGPSDGAYLGRRLPALLGSLTLLAVSSLLFLGVL